MSPSLREEIHYQHTKVSRHLHLCSLAGLDLGCNLFSPHAGSWRGSFCPAGMREYRHILQADTEFLAHPRSLIFSPSAQPHSALLKQHWDVPAEDALRCQGPVSQGYMHTGWLLKSPILLLSPQEPSPPLHASLQPVKCVQFLIAPALEGGYNSASF